VKSIIAELKDSDLVAECPCGAIAMITEDI